MPINRLLSFTEARALYLRGLTTPREQLEIALDRIDRLEPDVKAFVHLDKAAARLSADNAARRYQDGLPRSVLDGCLLGVKDIIDTADMPTRYGSPAFEGHQPVRDAPCVHTLRSAGAVIIGKTVSTEFAYGRSGPTTNPVDHRRTPGGSSSGSAASVASGMVQVAIGTQTQASIVRPASYCGVFGFKPSYGACDLTGVHPVSPSHDHLGVFSSSLSDAWMAANILSRNNLGGPPHAVLPVSENNRTKLLRLTLTGWDEIPDGAQEDYETYLGQLAAAGVEIVDGNHETAVRTLEDKLNEGIESSLSMVAYDMAAIYRPYMDKFGDLIGPRIQEMVATGQAISEASFLRMCELRDQAQAAATKVLHELGASAFVMPASSGPAPCGLEYTGSRTLGAYWSWLGFPAISVPAMTFEGLPWGVQFADSKGNDAALYCTVQNVLASAGASHP